MDNQKMAEFTIKIENESDARANVLAQELRDRLRRAHENIRVERRKDDPNSQDLGSILNVFFDWSTSLPGAVFLALLVDIIKNFIFQKKSPITINCPNGAVFPITKKDINFSIFEELENFLKLCLQDEKRKNILSPEETLVIIFGTSEGPGCSQEIQNSFINSAEKMKDYFLTQFGVKENNLGYFFNSEASTDEMIEKMREFIRDRMLNHFDNLLFYYVGPGEFVGEDYCFRCLPKENNSLSSIFPIQYLIRVTEEAKNLRHYFIVDASFSGATHELLSKFPSNRTILFCSSSKKEISKDIKQEPLTMFTGALVDIFAQNSEQFSSRLPVHELYPLVKDFIREKYKDEAVMPEFHVIESKEK